MRRVIFLAAFSSLVLAGAAAALVTGSHRTTRDRPDERIIQSAYDAAKSESTGRHYDDLHVEKAECSILAPHQFMCQVGFTRQLEKSERLYFDVVTMSETADRWQLVSGLCRPSRI